MAGLATVGTLARRRAQELERGSIGRASIGRRASVVDVAALARAIADDSLALGTRFLSLAHDPASTVLDQSAVLLLDSGTC